MHTITTPRTFITILASLLTLLTPTALAQESHNPARECIHHIEHVTARTVAAIHQIGDRRVDAIRALDASGADDNQIRQVAREGRENINERAMRGSDRVQSLVQNCVEQLVADGAPIPVIMSVINAGQEARDRIAQGAQNNIERINRNLYLALNN